MLRVGGFDPGVVVPRLGRFEALSGAKSFIGTWKLFSQVEGPVGQLVLLRNGDVELRSNDGVLVGTGKAPWTYKSPKAPDTIVKLSFTL
jgi:hypothetical protein